MKPPQIVCGGFDFEFTEPNRAFERDVWRVQSAGFSLFVYAVRRGGLNIAEAAL